MEDVLHQAMRFAVMTIEAMAFTVIVIGTAEAFYKGLWAALGPSASEDKVRVVWLRYGRWLIAGLSFQLAADIIGTSASPNWQDIGQLAAIAVVRTFLNFFLERDLAEIEERESNV